MTRWLGLLALSTFGCEAVVPIDLHYSDGGPIDVGHATDSPAAVDGEVAIGMGGLCLCGMDPDAGTEPFTNGEGCCIPKGSASSSAFCTIDNTDCAGSGGLFVGCQGNAIDSQCCWSNLTSSGSSAELVHAGSCGSRPIACINDTDCAAGIKCNIATCGGITVGSCGIMPSCP